MVAGVGGLSSPIIEIKRGSDADPSIDIPLKTLSTTISTIVEPMSIVNGTHNDDGGT